MPAVYVDCRELRKGHRVLNFRTGEKEYVGGCELLTAGFSCKDISCLNANPSKLCDPERGTGQTLEAVLNYTRDFRPEILVLENVKTMFHCRSVDGGKQPICILNSLLASLQYLSPDPCHSVAKILRLDYIIFLSPLAFSFLTPRA